MGVFIFLTILGLLVLIYFQSTASFKILSPRRFSKPVSEFHNSKLVGVLLGLEADALEELFGLYKNEFGNGAARYAQKTYRKWQAGKVRPNEQTYLRFLFHLPKVMSYDLKIEVLRHLMEEYCAKSDYELKIYTDDWEETLQPLVEEIIAKTYRAALPREIEEKLKWLAEGEMQLAQKILKNSQAEESKVAVSMLRGEIEAIEKLFTASNVKPKITHQLKFPYGTITLKIKRR